MSGTRGRMRSELDKSRSESSKTCRPGVRGASRDIRTWAWPRWQHTSGYPMSEKKKEGLAGILRVQTLSQQGTIRGGGRRMGRREGRRMTGTVTTAYPHRSIHHGLPTAPTLGRVAVVGFESCMLTKGTKGGVGSREMATPAVYRISTSGLLIRWGLT
jgi:hypothetical protein